MSIVTIDLKRQIECVFPINIVLFSDYFPLTIILLTKLYIFIMYCLKGLFYKWKVGVS